MLDLMFLKILKWSVRFLNDFKNIIFILADGISSRSQNLNLVVFNCNIKINHHRDFLLLTTTPTINLHFSCSAIVNLFAGNVAMGRGQHSLQRASYVLCTIVFIIITLCLFMENDRPVEVIHNSDFLLIDDKTDNTTDIINEWLERRNKLVSNF